MQSAHGLSLPALPQAASVRARTSNGFNSMPMPTRPRTSSGPTTTPTSTLPLERLTWAARSELPPSCRLSNLPTPF